MSVTLIADSGSTKTDWRILTANGSIAQARTIGLNPFYQDANSIAQELTANLKPQVEGEVSRIFFYGTGCAGEQAIATMRSGLQTTFGTDAHIEVESDMLGAARALCGGQMGIACILGTGSNNALCDGHQVLSQVPSLGFWLGDEGSGGYLGKTLVVRFLQQELPEDLHQKFEKRYAIDRLTVLENAYKKPFPNRYFAGFSKFLFDHRSHPYAYAMLYDAFSAFFKMYICKHAQHTELPVHLVGSVAFYYSDIIRRVASDLGVRIGHIMETPIAGLALYHCS